MIKLDEKDRKLLYALDFNYRIGNAEIGKKIGLSKAAIGHRINILFKKGVLKWIGTVLNPYILNYTKIKVYIKLQNASKEKISEIIDYFKNHDKTEWVASCAGEWDIIVAFMVKDIYEFDEVFQKTQNDLGVYFLEKQTTITKYVDHFRKDWLVKKDYRTPEIIIQGGKKINFELDKDSAEILKIITNNGRASTVQIAKKAGISTKTVASKMKKMKEQNIILTTRILIDLSKINHMFLKSFIYLKSAKENRIKDFREYCKNNPYMVYLTYCIGSWDMEIDWEIENFEKFNEEMLKLREEFGDIIARDGYAVITNEHKLDYFPGCYKPFDH